MQGLDKFKVDTFRCVIDQISSSLNEIFSQNTPLIEDVQYLHPSYFMNIKNTMPPNALKLIGNLINASTFKYYKMKFFQLLLVYFIKDIEFNE